MRRRPPAISLTRLTYSSAISLKMSLAPHAPCILITIGDWDLAIIGKPSAAAPAPAAPVRNLRRLATDGVVSFCSSFLFRKFIQVSFMVQIYRCETSSDSQAQSHSLPGERQLQESQETNAASVYSIESAAQCDRPVTNFA